MLRKKATKLGVHLVPNEDPLGISRITLGGDAPSLHVEARIVAGQWTIQKGSSNEGGTDDGPEEQT